MRPGSGPRATSQRRQPAQRVLYRTIAAHLPTFRRGCRAASGGALPVPVRCQLAFAGGLTRAVRRVVLRTVFGWQRPRAARRGVFGARRGRVTALPRFGGSANLTVHCPALVFDGGSTRATPTARPGFHRLPPPADADLAALLRRLMSRRGRWPDEEEPLFASAGAASLQGRVALGPRAGQPVRRLRSAADAMAPGDAPPGWRGSVCTPTSWCRGAGGTRWSGGCATWCGRRWRRPG